MSMILLFGIHLIYYNGTFGPVEVMPWPMNYSMEAHVHRDRFEGFLFSSHQPSYEYAHYCLAKCIS